MNVSENNALRLLLRCQSVNEVLSDYIDGELGPVDRMLLWGHLTMCGRCRDYLKQFRRIVELAGTLPGDELPPDAENALRGALKAWKDGEKGD